MRKPVAKLIKIQNAVITELSRYSTKTKDQRGYYFVFAIYHNLQLLYNEILFIREEYKLKSDLANDYRELSKTVFHFLQFLETEISKMIPEDLL